MFCAFCASSWQKSMERNAVEKLRLPLDLHGKRT